ncbi:protein KHNYN [Brachionichthys hirsutus]|uniref:protein KHNYN n=1 Tax=Brachionichthys hirsutus TaxID=412623 RepID=UPI0036045122
MDGEKSGGGGGGEAEVVDEFACDGVLRGSLGSHHGTVERIFGVTFDIGVDESPRGNNGQIWLKLRGRSGRVKAAKLFVKGVLNQEAQREISYPGVLHCVFCGGRGLFMDSLMRSTSAHIVVGSVGFLLISGLAEPVVRAYSLITDLVEKYEGTQSRRSEAGDRGSGESLDSRRAFKALVEKWEDRHILDLLVLPGLVKEILLDLVKDSGLGSYPSPPREDSFSRWDGTTDPWIEGTAAGSTEDSYVQPVSTSGGAEGADEGLASPQRVGEEDQVQRVATPGAEGTDGRRDEEEQELQFLLLLKFFTAMGYTDAVVKRVLARTGLKEASQILDLVQQEQDASGRDQTIQRRPANQENGAGIASNQSEMDQRCRVEHGEGDQTAGGGELLSNNETGGEVAGGATGSTRRFEGVGGAEGKEGEPEEEEEDFVYGVVKKAAARCGYTEQKVAKVYSMLPDRSSHQLLLELQRDGSDREEGRKGIGHVVPDKGGQRVGEVEDERRGEVEPFVSAERRECRDKGGAASPKLSAPVSEPGFSTWDDQSNANQRASKPPASQAPPRNALPEVKGPPTATYPSSLGPAQASFQSDKQHGHPDRRLHPPASRKAQAAHDKGALKGALQAPRPSTVAGGDSSPAGARDRRGVAAASSVVVTGQQRFLESLRTPFELALTDEPGDPKLRTVVIDGSNVAMSHGLGHFFSCRGIALAVQHFWDRGHRDVCALLPQWRQKSNPKATEQHYLQELQKLGMVSYTPSREVQGKRITSYDDRLMLQHAQKTDGVIVTNDNLRDLTDETPVWRDIIKKRLLQYTFVGDHFMVPDDPLGRGGPHLDDFLRSEHSAPHPGRHSFAGASATFPSSCKSPRSQTELLQLRDRTPGGALDETPGSGGGGGGGGDRGVATRGEAEHQDQFGRHRSPDETETLRQQLCLVFAGQEHMVQIVLLCYPDETDVNFLTDLILVLI